MDSVLNTLIVTALFFVIAAVVGRRLQKSPIPYDLTIFSIHIGLFVLLTGGTIASIDKINGVTETHFFSKISLYIVMFLLIANMVIGTSMSVSKRKDKQLIVAHKLSTALMGISIFSGIVFMIAKV